MTLIESSLLVVAFATWARARAKGDHEGFHRAVSTAIWWVFLLAPPVLGGMVVLIHLAWLLAGAAFSRLFHDPVWSRRVNIAFAAALVATTVYAIM